MLAALADTEFSYANEAVTSLGAHLHTKIPEAVCWQGGQYGEWVNI